MRTSLHRVLIIMSLGILLCFSHGFCQGTATTQLREDTVENIEALVNRLRQKGVITQDEADIYIQRYQDEHRRQAEAGKGTQPDSKMQEDLFDELAAEVAGEISDDIRLQVKKEIKDEIIQEARLSGWPRNIPSWVNSLTLGGDLRLRYHADYYDSSNAEFLKPTNPTELLNTTEDRKRLRARARLNLNAKITDRVETGIRLSTGSTEDPVSTMVTFGDYMNKKSVALDLAYLKYKPMPEMTLWGGRMPNPWYCTDLVWDSDLNFEGLVFNFDTQLMRHARGFVTAGVFPIQEEEWTGDDKWLYGGQVGFLLSYTPSSRYKPVISLTVAGAYYDYKNITGEMNDPAYPGEKDWTAPDFQQMGNTLMMINYDTENPLLALAADYNLANVTAVFDLGMFDPVHIVISGDYVRNVGFDKDDVAQRTGVDPIYVKEEITGHQVGLSIGYIKVRQFGQWRCYLYQRRLGADAVLDAFTDSNFHKGGTNAKGRTLGFEFGLTNNVWLSTRWITSDEIEGPAFAVDTLLMDLNVKF